MGVLDDPLDKLKRNARKQMRQCGNEHLAEDFYQYLFIVRAKNWKQSYRQAAIDFLRDELDSLPGTSGKKGPWAPWMRSLDEKQHSADFAPDSEINFRYIPRSEFDDSWSKIRIVYYDYIHIFNKGMECALFVLHFLLEFDYRQLGLVFNCHETQIPLMMEPVKKKLKKEIERKRQAGELTRDPQGKC